MTETKPRYTIQIISHKRGDEFAYVNDAVTGDVARACTGMNGIAEAEAWASRWNLAEAKARQNEVEDVVGRTLAPHRRRVGFLAFAGLVRRVADRAQSPFMVSVELIETGVFTNAQADALAVDIAARVARI